MYSSSNATAVIKLEIMRWAGHVARMGREKVLTGIDGETREKRNRLKDLSVDDRIIIIK
jgi:hypothetical protein